MIRAGTVFAENLHGLVRVHRGVLEHAIKMIGAKKVRTRACHEDATRRENLHRAQIYFLVAAVRLLDHLCALGERRRIKDDEVESPALALVFLEKIENVGGERAHDLSSAVERDVRVDGRDGIFGNIDGNDR